MALFIKICGITRPEDAVAAARAGADAVGLMFAARSPRRLDIEAAGSLADAMPPGLRSVGVFMDNDPGGIEAVLKAIPLDLLQFHGSESPANCRRWGFPYIKAVPMSGEGEPVEYMDRYPDAAGFLLDAFRAGEPGGRGKRFDWSRVPSPARRNIILAGGLTPDNAAEAVRVAKPYGLDVSSGVESSPGIKDPALMNTFIEEARRAAGGFD